MTLDTYQNDPVDSQRNDNPLANPTDLDSSELTLDQKLRFKILVPLVSDLKIKHQEEIGSLIKADESGYYTAAIDAIQAIIARECDKARIDEIQELVIAQGSYAEDRAYGHGAFHHVPVKEVEDRLAQLKVEAAQKGNDDARS